MHADRRRFLKSSGIILSIALGGEILRLSPSGARAAGLPYQVLTADEVTTLEGLAEAIVPGARKAGIAHFIDKQLAADPEDSLLMLKYLGVPAAGFTDFYRGGLTSAAKLASSRFGQSWLTLDAEQSSALLAEIAGDTAAAWEGPPASFFFFVLRSDACDVVYGTASGFDRAGVPYMAHIEPAETW